MGHLFLRFALVGLVNTAVGYGVILLLHYVGGMSPIAANAGGYAVGTAISYVLNRSFTFGSRRPHGQALPRFGVTVAACFLLNLLILQIGVSLNLPVAVAQALAVAGYTLAFYAASRLLVFKA